MTKCNCLFTDEKKYDLAAKMVVILLTDERFKSLPFELFDSGRNKKPSEFSEQELSAFNKFSIMFHKALYEAHSALFKGACDITDDKALEDFYSLVLNTYKRNKNKSVLK